MERYFLISQRDGENVWDLAAYTDEIVSKDDYEMVYSEEGFKTYSEVWRAALKKGEEFGWTDYSISTDDGTEIHIPS